MTTQRHNEALSTAGETHGLFSVSIRISRLQCLVCFALHIRKAADPPSTFPSFPTLFLPTCALVPLMSPFCAPTSLNLPNPSTLSILHFPPLVLTPSPPILFPSFLLPLLSEEKRWGRGDKIWRGERNGWREDATALSCIHTAM